MWTKKIFVRHEDFELNFYIVDEPSTFQQGTTSDAWRSVVQREYDALIKNGIWRLVDPQIGTKCIGCKWVYKKKYNPDGSLDKHKERLLTKGYAQREGVDLPKLFLFQPSGELFEYYFL